MKARTKILLVVSALLLAFSVPIATMFGLVALGATVSTSSVAVEPPVPLTLNSISYASSHNVSLSVPTSSEIASSLGSSYSVQGVFIEYLPHIETDTASDGSSFTRTTWQAALIIWNENAVNGTTTNLEILGGNGILLTEDPVVAGSNSTAVALAIAAPPVVCTTTTVSGVTSQVGCQTYSQSNGVYITKYDGLSIVVGPASDGHGGSVIWLDSRNDMSYGMHSDSVSVTTMLQLAEAMIA